MRLATLVFLFITSNVNAQSCLYELKPDSLKLEWTAFKTPKKIGVKGSFDKLNIKGLAKGPNFSSLFNGLTFSLDTKSINTSDQARDKRIFQSFFSNMGGGTNITGGVLGYKRKILQIAIKMNNKEVIVPLTVEKSEHSFTALGHIDILDFAMGGNLASLNEACNELHEGKTWNDVGIALSGKFSKSCK